MSTQRGMRGVRTYRKYSNRRLYDPKGSHYCTLLDIIHAVRNGDTVEVLQHKGDDITREVLLDALKVQELKTPRLSVEKLHELLRG
jgi:polyhydroxyalkanoate synthesis regulator protein